MSAASDILVTADQDEIGSRERSQSSPDTQGDPAFATSAARDSWAQETVSSQPLSARTSAWNPESFAQQQILSLVQRVFFPGWPRASRQVVFSSVDGYADSGSICARVSITMSERVPGTVCVIEADRNGMSLQRALESTGRPETYPGGKGIRVGHRVRENLWLLRVDELLETQTFSLVGVRSRLSELRRQFDYTVIHAPAVGACSETGFLGQIADGVIWVVDERNTRRAIAREAKQILIAANARLLGVVINDRQFPIPETIYRKL